jgi:hypothetical protein
VTPPVRKRHEFRLKPADETTLRNVLESRRTSLNTLISDWIRSLAAQHEPEIASLIPAVWIDWPYHNPPTRVKCYQCGIEMDIADAWADFMHIGGAGTCRVFYCKSGKGHREGEPEW